MTKVEKTYFFTPRLVPELYRKGFEHYRTLVLGVFFVCENKSCPFRKRCLKDSRAFNETCPDCHGEELRDGNFTEVGCYINDAAKYPAFNSLTKYLLRSNLHPSVEDKRRVWDSIAFTNYLQNFQDGYDTLSYHKDKAKFLKDVPAFRDVLDELEPEVIYVIDDAVAECLKENFPELTYSGKCESWTLPIHRFIGKVVPKDTPENISRSFKNKRLLPKSVLNGMESLRSMDRLQIDCPSKMRPLIAPHIWDRELQKYILKKELMDSMGEGKFACLMYVLGNLYNLGFTQSPDSIIFRPLKVSKYILDGIVIEIMADFHPDCVEYDFIRFICLPCGSEKEWRYRKKEYTVRKKNTDHGGTRSRKILTDVYDGMKFEKLLEKFLKEGGNPAGK